MPQVNHIDGNKENNRLDNFEFCTAKENINHAYKTGLHSKRGRLTYEELNQIVNMLNTGTTYREIAIMFNISSTYVSQIAAGKRHRELYEKINIPENKVTVKVKCLETGKTYNSLKEAALDLNISVGDISKNLKGKRSHVGGYHFERVEEKEI